MSSSAARNSLIDRIRRRAEISNAAVLAHDAADQETRARQVRALLDLRRNIEHAKRQESQDKEVAPRSVESKIQAARASSNPAGYADVKRILMLPVRYELSDEEVEEFNRENLLVSAYESGFRLWPVQCRAIMEYDEIGGLVGPIGVGHGKSAISLMISERAYRKGRRRVLLINTPSVYGQFVSRDIPWARSRVPLSVPIYPLGQRTAKARMAYAKAKRRGCYILPCSILSGRDASNLLDELAPDVIIIDEAHNFSNPTAARTKRVQAYLNDQQRMYQQGRRDSEVEVICLSGTLTRKSIREYHWMLARALHEGSPLPMSAQMTSEWAQVIDATSSGSMGGQTAPLQPVVSWARKTFPDKDFAFDTSGFRHAYQMRLNSCPGVVATGDAEIGTELVIANKPVQQPETCGGWERLVSLIEDVTERWVTPNGDEIEHAIHTWKWLYELSAGFYNQLTWPSDEQLAERRSIPVAEAKGLLERSREHLAAHSNYARELRGWTDAHGRAGLDTPMLIGQSMHRHGSREVGHLLYSVWREMKDLEFDGMPERDASAIRVCPYKIDDAVEDAVAHKQAYPKRGKLYWYYNQDVGHWLYTEMRAKGLDALHCPAGEVSNKLLNLHENPETARRLVILSISAHKEGKNLQGEEGIVEGFRHQRYVQWPRSAARAEQSLGRTHRNGQVADELVVETNLTTEFDRANFAACLNDAVYTHATTGNRQKLVYANYDPPPITIPSSVLISRGFQSKLLAREHAAMIEEKFGGPQ